MTPVPKSGEEALLLATMIFETDFEDEDWDAVAAAHGRNDPELVRHMYYEGLAVNPGGPTAWTTRPLAMRTHFPTLPQRLPPTLGLLPAGTTTTQPAVAPALPQQQLPAQNPPATTTTAQPAVAPALPSRQKRTAEDANLDVKEEELDDKAGCCKAPVTKKRKRDDRTDEDEGAGGAAGAGMAC